MVMAPYAVEIKPAAAVGALQTVVSLETYSLFETFVDRANNDPGQEQVQTVFCVGLGWPVTANGARSPDGAHLHSAPEFLAPMLGVRMLRAALLPKPTHVTR
jgi:hypothetical protein